MNTGQPLVGAILFPVGFCLLYLLGFVSGKVIAMWMPIMVFFYMVFEHIERNPVLFWKAATAALGALLLLVLPLQFGMSKS